MNKVSSREVYEVLSQVPGVIRSLVEERDFWRKEAESRMLRDEAEKVANAMREKGISTDVPYEVLVEQLEKAASQGKLERIAEAVDLVGPNMGQKIANISNDDSHDHVGATDLERFILGGGG